MIKQLILITISLLFLACGDGGTSVETTPLKNIQFVDSPVNGIDYVCGKRKMQTQTKEIKGEIKHGIASCRYEPVIFSLGSLVLGQIDTFKDGQVIYPQDLVKVSQNIFENEEVLKIAMFIQSLDDDGDINKSINITDEIKSKISFKTLNKLTIEEVKSKIKNLEKIPLNINAVKEHIMINSGIPYIKDLTITILDNQAIGSTIGILDIINQKNISKIKILKGENSDYFTFNKTDGSIKVAKRLNYKKIYRYNIDIQAKSINDSKGDSNIATVTIIVNSATPSDMKTIPKAIIKNSTIYTNTNIYSVTVEGRVGTNIYVDGMDINKTIPTTGKIKLIRKSSQNNSHKEFSLTLGYDNGKRSEATLFTLIHDNIKPTIKTNPNLSIKENIKIITNIETEDNSDVNYSISGVDSNYFNISNIGELSFKNRKDYENPLDSNKNNIYDITIKAIDKAGNSSSEDFAITVIDILDSPPTINPLVIDIVTDTIVGSKLGTISIQEGDSPVSKIELVGDGVDNFQLNSDGTLLVIKNMHTVTTYRLTIQATNKFGTTTGTITINVKDGSKLAKAQLGLLTGATVKIIKLNQETDKEELVYTEKTSDTGTFNTHSKELEDDTFYIFEVSEGVDIDANNDGIKDNISTPNKGVLRLIAKGEWIKKATSIIRVTPLSEMQYDYVVKYIKNVDNFDYNKIDTILNESSRVLLSEDLTGDETIDINDILAFNPIMHQSKLYRTLKNNNLFSNITNQIRDNNMSYVKEFFFSCILKTFENTDSFKIEGSFAYAYGNNHFYIYDIFNQKKVSEIYLPKTYNNSFIDDYNFRSNIVDLRVKIYLDLSNNLVYLSSLDEYTVPINIEDINNPKIEYHYIVGAGKYIVKKYKNTLFFSEGIPSFYAQKDLSRTICGDGGCIRINYDNSDFNYTVGNATALELSDPYNPTIFTTDNFPFFPNIKKQENKLFGYTMTLADDITRNSDDIYAHQEYDINAYNITNIQKEQSVSIETQYRIKDYDNWDYFDEAGYFYTTAWNTANTANSTLNIYKLSDTLEHKGVLQIWKDYRFNETINRYGQTLYISGFDEKSSLLVYFINILDPERAYVYNTIYMGRIDPSSFKFYDTIFRTQKDIIDLKSFIYANPYITNKETLDRKNKFDFFPFQKFLIN